MKDPFSNAVIVAQCGDQVHEASDSHQTVAEYIVGRIAELGVKHAFGLPGDFAFAIDDAIDDHPGLEWVVCANELNASYAADAYARIHGAALLTTTYGVGELSAINGVMGSFAERCPVFHLVGYPGERLTRTGRVLYHSTASAMVKTDEFRAMASQSCCVSYVATDPGLVAIEMDRVISTALREKRPAYVAVPKDVGKMQIPEDIAPSGRKTLSIDLRTASSPSSVEAELKAAVLAVKNRLTRSKSPIVLVSFMCQRLGLVGKVTQLIEKLNLKFVLTSMDKGTMPESHPNYIGLYKGEASCAAVVNAVNSSDLVIDLGGVLFDDLSTGFGTSMILKKDMITIGHTVTTLGDDSMDRIQEHPRSYGPVFLGDVLDALLGDESLVAFPSRDIPSPLPWPEYNSPAPGITYASIASSLQQFLKPDDVFVLETGTCSLFLSNLLLPENCAYMNQTLWGSIGWGTPACFGACLAAPDRQVVFVTGDGSHQLTANEIGAMQRYGTSPIVLVLNNGLFGVEEFLEKNAMKEYNVIADWKYADVARAMGTAWECVKVDTIQGLQEALTKARSEEKGTYIEVMMSEKLLDPLTSSALSKEYMDRP